MFSGILRLGLLPLICSVCFADDVDKLRDSVQGLKKVVADLSKHIMQLSFQDQERVRAEGSSGLVKVRGYTIGPNSYHLASHVGESFANMHDHSNYQHLYGLGDFMAVVNGVQFRTRHNDFEPRMASRSSKAWLATDAIAPPPMPKGFDKLSVDEQIEEVIEYIKAFKLQDEKIRPYKDFFKPVLCYLEGWWDTEITAIENGFTSIRHSFVAKSWKELRDRAKVDAYLGSDHNIDHDGASLPVTIVGFNESTQLPIYAQWNYRVLCHPIGEDVPISYLKPVEDLAYRQRRKINATSLNLYKGSRYVLDEVPEDMSQRNMTVDRYVSKIPGLDNVPGVLSEKKFGRPETGNLGFYNRAYPTGSDKDAMSSFDELRGFSDGNMYVAMTTQEKVAPLVVEKCTTVKKVTTCEDVEIRCSWMFPMEIMYMTPLQNWNPMNLPHSSEKWTDYEKYNGKKMDGKKEKTAFFGTHDRNFYRIPSKMFSKFKPTDLLKADSFGATRYIRDSKGTAHLMIASGPRMILPAIDGVGETRLRYPIAPLHEEGTGVWEELDGFVDYLSQQFSYLEYDDDV